MLDVAFIRRHTSGFEQFEAMVRALDWSLIEQESGLTRESIEGAAQVYVEAERVTAFYGMGLTQQVHGFENVAALVNLMLLRGNIGREGTGVSPVRGHSNVQGQRTVGISEKPEQVPLDKFAAQFGFEPPREKGMNTVETCEGLLSGTVKAFIGLGGNFVRAIPEREKMEEAWTKMRLTVQIATKLNRSHLINGKVAYLLPARSHRRRDLQGPRSPGGGMEDTFSHIVGSIGRRKPASAHLRSEVAIVAGLAKATLSPNPKLKWDEWVGDYGLIREQIEQTYSEMFRGYGQRMWQPGGFYKGNKARERIWETNTGKAEFTTPKFLNATGFDDVPGRYRLITMRSNDQFNTTIYGFSDRLRGIEGTRQVLLINPKDMERAGLSAGQMVSLISDAEDSVHREVGPLKVTPFNESARFAGFLGGYYPEMNPLIPLSHHAQQSKPPASKAVAVQIKA